MKGLNHHQQNSRNGNHGKEEMAISAKQRKADLMDVHDDFCQFLWDSRGVVLPRSLRCAVAQCAVDTLLRNLPRHHGRHRRRSEHRQHHHEQSDDSDEKHHHNRHQHHAVDNEDIGDPEFQYAGFFHTNVSEQAAAALLPLIHDIIHRQSSLDAEWYDETINNLRCSGLIPSRFNRNKKEKQALAWSLYCEVLLLTTVAHALHVTFRLLGQDMPSLPKGNEVKEGTPLYLQWWSTVREDRTIRLDSHVAFTPFLKATDLRIDSKESKRVSEAAWDVAMRSMDTVSLWCGAVLAPEDLEFARYLVSVFQVDEHQTSAPFQNLDPKSRCADVFQRSDIEKLSLEMAKAYRSDHCVSTHKVALAGTVDRHKATEELRHTLLKDLAFTMTSRPFSQTKIEEIRKQMETQLGESFWVEAAGVVGAMELMTKIGNATGKTAISSTLGLVGKGLVKVRRLLA